MEHDLDPQRFFEQVTATACEDLFGRYGFTARQAGDGDAPISPEFFLASVIGFTGRDVRGTLVVALTEQLSGSSNPIAGADPAGSATSVTQRDWVGELSNQLLGRIKLELLRAGVEIYLNLPAVLRGQHLAPLPREQLKPLKFAMADGAVAVWVEVEAGPGFKIAADTTGADTPAAGDALLFE
jgi:CheY-specific phosphatase CheX